MSPLILLYAAFVVLPLCGSLVIEPFISIKNFYAVKEFLAISFALGFSLMTFVRGSTHRPAINHPLLLLILFLPLCVYSAPPISLAYGHEDMGGLWMWRAVAWALVYLLFYFAVLHVPIVRERDKGLFAFYIGIAVVLSAAYAMAQAMGLDQWQYVLHSDIIGLPEQPEITAMMGNSMYLGIYLVIGLPFLILYWNRYAIFPVIGAILICKSDIATAGLIITLFFLAGLRLQSTTLLKIGVGVVFVGVFVMVAFWSDIRPHLKDGGRFAVYAQTLEDWTKPCLSFQIPEKMTGSERRDLEALNKRTWSMTGRGPGSFPFIFGPKYTTRFESVHSEPLEALYSIGSIGSVLFWCAVAWVLWYAFPLARSDRFACALYTSFVFILFASCFSPIWHNEPLRYVSVGIFSVLSALIPRKNILK